MLAHDDTELTHLDMAREDCTLGRTAIEVLVHAIDPKTRGIDPEVAAAIAAARQAVGAAAWLGAEVERLERECDEMRRTITRLLAASPDASGNPQQ